MSASFTEALRALEDPGEARWGAVERLLTGLRDALSSELRRRGLWDSPPSYLGVVGSLRWDAEALDELAEDCYIFNLARLRSLRAQLRLKANVDGFVLLNVRHFVFERQRAHDPLGYRLYEVLAGAAERLLQAGTLHLLAGGPKLRNETLLGFTPGTGARLAGRKSWPPSRPPGTTSFSKRSSRPPAAATARPATSASPNGWPSCRGEASPPSASATSSSPGNATRAPAGPAAPTKARAGRSTTPKTAHCCGWYALSSPTPRWKTARASRVSWRASPRACKAAKAKASKPSCGRSGAASPATPAIRRADVPSQRAIATATGIPRHRLPALYAELGRMIEACRAATGAAAKGGAATGDRSPVNQRQPAAAAEDVRPSAPTLACVASSSKPRRPSSGKRPRRRPCATSDRQRPATSSSTRRRRPGRSSGSSSSSKAAARASSLPTTSPRSRQAILSSRPTSPAAARLADRPIGIDRAAQLAVDQRSGRVSRAAVERVRFLVERAAAESAPSAALDEELASWQTELDDARAALLAAAPAAARPASPQRFGSPRFFAIAASVVLVANEVLVGRLAIVASSSMERLERERRGSAATLADLEAARQRLAAKQRELDAASAALEAAHAREQENRRQMPLAPINVPFLWLAADETVRGEAATLTVPVHGDLVMLIVPLVEPSRFPRYRAELLRAGNVVWHSDELVPTGVAELSFALPRSVLPPGDYRLRVAGLRASAATPMATFRFRVAAPAASSGATQRQSP